MRRPVKPTGFDLRDIVPARWFEFILGWTLRHAYRHNDYLSLITIRAARESVDSAIALGLPGLRELADVVVRAIRDVDLLGECAGGELGILCLDVDAGEANQLAQRIADAIRSVEFSAPLTFTIGVAACPRDGSDVSGLVEHAASHPVMSVRGSVRAATVAIAAHQRPTAIEPLTLSEPP